MKVGHAGPSVAETACSEVYVMNTSQVGHLNPLHT